MNALTFKDLSTSALSQLISRKESFEVIGLRGKMLEAVRQVETSIETAGLRCRVYTPGRIGVAAASFTGGISGVLGIAGAAGIALHNLATFNPDYEIQKDVIDNRLVVRYKKKGK